MTLDSKALEAAARTLFERQTGGDWDGLTDSDREFYLADAKPTVAAYLDEAGIPTRWCEQHGAIKDDGTRHCRVMETLSDVAIGQPTSINCRIVDAVLVLGENE